MLCVLFRVKMMLISSLIFELMFAALVHSKPTTNAIVESPENSLSIANNEFSFKVFKLLSKEGQNSVMSPMSINTAFSILMNGADRETLTDMRQFLEYQNQAKNVTENTINEGFKAMISRYKNPAQNRPSNQYENKPAHLLVANRVFRNESLVFLPNFERTVRQHFGADIQSSDFKNNAVEETRKVNQWVSDATNGKITKIFDLLREDTSFVILNAAHFQGQWYKEFDKSQTKKQNFYNNGVTPVKTDMMHVQDHFNYYASQELDAQLLELNYYDKWLRSNFTFVVVLPLDMDGLSALKDKINATNLNSALRSMESVDTKVYLPKFKAQSEYDLMKDFEPKPLFLSGQAQFSRLSSEPQIVAEVKHKVYIDVNEKGTEAAAVTAIRGVPGMAAPPLKRREIYFVADRPFLYLIRDRSNGMILFIGQINNF